MNRFSDWFAARRKSLMNILGLGLTYAALKYGQTNTYVVWAIMVLGVVGVHEVPNKTDILQQLYQDVLSILHPKAPAPVTPPEPGPVVSSEPAAATTSHPIQSWGEV